MIAGLEIDGIPELTRLLDELPNAAQQRVMRPSMRLAARYVSDAVRRVTRRGPTGNLIKANTIRASRDGGVAGIAFKVGFLARLGAHAILVDKGSGLRVTKKGANRGKMPAFPFFDAAVESAMQGATTLLQMQWAQKLAIEARRLSRGQLDSRGRLRR